VRAARDPCAGLAPPLSMLASGYAWMGGAASCHPHPSAYELKASGIPIRWLAEWLRRRASGESITRQQCRALSQGVALARGTCRGFARGFARGTTAAPKLLPLA